MRIIQQFDRSDKHPTRGDLILPLLGLCIGVLAFPASSLAAQGSPQGQSQAQKTPASTGPQNRAGAAGHTSLTYDQMVQRAKALVSSRSQDALQFCQQAIQKDPSRYEAHVIAAAALRQQNKFGRALIQIQVANALAPDEEKPGLARAIAEMKVASLPAESRRKLDSLMLILDDAQAAKSVADREKFLREFLEKSDSFLSAYPSISDLWLLRAQIAIDLDEPVLGWQAGRKLIEFSVDQSGNAITRRLMAKLERNGWLTQSPAELFPKLIDAFNRKAAEIGVQRAEGLYSNGTYQGTDGPIIDDRGAVTERITNEWDSLSGTCQTGLVAALKLERRMEFTQRTPKGGLRYSTWFANLILNLKIAEAGTFSVEHGNIGFFLKIYPLDGVNSHSNGHIESNDNFDGSVIITHDTDVSIKYNSWEFSSSNRANLDVLASLLRQMHQVCADQAALNSPAKAP